MLRLILLSERVEPADRIHPLRLTSSVVSIQYIPVKLLLFEEAGGQDEGSDEREWRTG